MPIGKRHVALVHEAVVPGPQNVSYLMGNRHCDGGASVMHDEEGFVPLWADAGRQTTAVRIVDDQTDDVGMLLVAQLLYVLEGTEPIDHGIEVGELIVGACIVFDQLTVHEPQGDVAEAAVPERC